MSDLISSVFLSSLKCSDLRGVGVAFSGVRIGVTTGVLIGVITGVLIGVTTGVLTGVTAGVMWGVNSGPTGYGWLEALSWILDVNSRIRLVVDDGVRRFKLPDVVSGNKEKKNLINVLEENFCNISTYFSGLHYMDQTIPLIKGKDGTNVDEVLVSNKEHYPSKLRVFFGWFVLVVTNRIPLFSLTGVELSKYESLLV